MEILIAFGFVLLAGFFAGSETALISVNRIKLHSNLESTDRRYHVLEWLLNHPEDMLGTMLIGTNICIVASTIVFSSFMYRVTGQSSFTPLLVTLIMTPVVLLFSDVFPKIIFRRFADGLTHFLAYLYLFFFFVLFPVQFIFVRSIKAFLTLIGFRKKKKGMMSREDFKVLLDISTNKGVMNDKEKEFIESIMNFKNVKAREIMVPLIQVACVEENDTVAKASNIMLFTRHGRLPVYRSRVDYIIGYIENKDVLNALPEDKVVSYLREALFVPETIEIDKLLVKMQATASRMVFTVDEYGGVSGVITTQDVIREIVGEFVGMDRSLLDKEKEGFIADGLLDIDELEDELGIEIEKMGFETVGGFAMFKLDKIPQKGDYFDYERFHFEVLSTRGHRVEKIKVTPRKRRRTTTVKPATEAGSDGN